MIAKIFIQANIISVDLRNAAVFVQDGLVVLVGLVYRRWTFHAFPEKGVLHYKAGVINDGSARKYELLYLFLALQHEKAIYHNRINIIGSTDTAE